MGGSGSGRGYFLPAAPLVEKRRRWMSSSVAAGILSLLMEMNCMRASSSESAVSLSLVKMTRMGMKPCWMYGRRKKSQSLGSSQGSTATVTFSLGWASKAAYSLAGLVGGAFLGLSDAKEVTVKRTVVVSTRSEILGD